MDTKSIIATLQDLESGFLTEEHMEAIKAARQIVERVDEEKISEVFKGIDKPKCNIINASIIELGKLGPCSRAILAAAITDYLEGRE